MAEANTNTTPEQEPNRIKYYALNALAAIDYVGEKLANFFGLTDSRYQDVLDEYHKIQEEEQRKRDEESKHIQHLEQGELDHNKT